jgi:hypothetical protein
MLLDFSDVLQTILKSTAGIVGAGSFGSRAVQLQAATSETIIDKDFG